MPQSLRYLGVTLAVALIAITAGSDRADTTATGVVIDMDIDMVEERAIVPDTEPASAGDSQGRVGVHSLANLYQYPKQIPTKKIALT